MYFSSNVQKAGELRQRLKIDLLPKLATGIREAVSKVRRCIRSLGLRVPTDVTISVLAFAGPKQRPDGCIRY